MIKNLTYKELITFFLLILVAAIFVGAVSFTYPFGRDQGINAYVAKLILNGKIDYKYSYNIKPPAIHYTFVLGELLFGESMFNLRIFDLIWQAATSFIIFLITFKFTKSKLAGFAAAFLYVFLYYRLDYWHTMQIEGFMNLPLCISILFLLKSNNEKRFLIFVSGFLFCIAFLYKFTIAPIFIFLCIYFLMEKKSTLIMRFRKVASFIVGFVLVLIIVIFYYYINGALRDMVEIQFIETPGYSKIGFETESSGFIIANLVRLFTYSVYAPVIFFSVVFWIILFKKHEYSFNYYILFLWFLSTIISLIIQWKFFIYYFLIIIPPVIISSVCLFHYLLTKFNFKYHKIVLIMTIVALSAYIGFAVKPYLSREIDAYNLITRKTNLNDLYIANGTTADSVFTFKKISAITEYVKENTNPKDGIYIWGIEPLIYYLSGRDCISRFTYNTAFFWRSNESEYVKEFLSELHTKNPKLFLLAKRDAMYYLTGFHEDSEQMLNKFPDIKKVIDNNYIFKTEIQEFKIYELNKAYTN